jgi:hypothetical protein
MSRKEINSEIQKILSSLPDLVLTKNLAKILKEYDNLLSRLANDH